MVMLCIGAGTSRAGVHTYVGFYADDYHTVCSIDITSAPQHFQVWLWVLPNDDGFIVMAFGYRYPSWVSLGSAYGNEDLAVAIGCPQDQYTTCLTFNYCQYDWVWLVRWDAWALEAGNAGEIYLVPTEWFGPPIMVGDCAYGEAPARILNNLHINEPCTFGTEETSWGAIKALYR
jgi:hypothetical protein